MVPTASLPTASRTSLDTIFRPVVVVIGFTLFPAPRSWRANKGKDDSGQPEFPSKKPLALR